MTTNHEIHTQLIKPQKWLEYMASKFEAELENDRSVVFENKYGSGIIKNFLIEDGLTLSKVDLLLTKSIDFHRNPSKHPLIMINVFLPDEKWEIEVSKKKYVVNKVLANGIFLTTSAFPAVTRVPSGIRYRYFAFVIQKSWLKHNGVLQDENFLSSEDISKPLFLLRHADLNILKQSKLLFDSLDEDLSQLPFSLRTEVLSLLSNILMKLSDKAISYTNSRLNHAEVNSIVVLSEEIINATRSKIPSVEDSASKIFMSPSKFRRLYKSIYGESYYSHIRGKRLEIAKELLESSGFSVSEVATQCGYSNHSKFSKAFKIHFKGLPKDVLPLKKDTLG